MTKRQMKTAQDYTSFGSIMEGRWYEADSFGYRFSLNGQEKDDEIYGKGNTTTAEFWEYDGRLGRRFNADPKPHPSISVYACFNNNPIWFNDPLGDSIEVREAPGGEGIGGAGSFGKMKSILEDKFKGCLSFCINDAKKLEYTFNETKIQEEATRTGKTVADIKTGILASSEFKRLDKMLSNARHFKIMLYDNNSTMTNGQFGSLQRMDMADIAKYDEIAELKPIGAYAAMMHEITEAFYFQVEMGKPSFVVNGEENKVLRDAAYSRAHLYAEKQQAQIMGVKSVNNGTFNPIPPDNKYSSTNVIIKTRQGKTKIITVYRYKGSIITKPDDL
jgi:hypothetical protein